MVDPGSIPVKERRLTPSFLHVAIGLVRSWTSRSNSLIHDKPHNQMVDPGSIPVKERRLTPSFLHVAIGLVRSWTSRSNSLIHDKPHVENSGRRVLGSEPSCLNLVLARLDVLSTKGSHYSHI